jgi:hypothetical protein
MSTYQKLNSYLYTNYYNSKLFLDIEGVSNNDISHDTINMNDIPQFTSPKTCKYILDSGPQRKSINIKIIEFSYITTGRLQIIGNLLGNDMYTILDVNDDSVYNMNIYIPCGQAIIMLDDNSTIDNSDPSYVFQMEYSVNEYDDGRECARYSKYHSMSLYISVTTTTTMCYY